MFKDKKAYLSVFILGVFCFYFYLAYSTPLTGDDWFWGSSAGMDKFNNWFENYNGRYLGNLTVLVLTRVDWIRIFSMALFATLLVVLVGNSAKLRFHFNYILSLFLFLCIPISIFSQTYAWTAGFANYSTSIVFILIYLAMIKNIFEEEAPEYRTWMTFAVIPLGIITQLFVEHVTIYAVFMSLFVIIYSLIKFKKLYSLQIAYFVSTVIGAVIMFTNGAYSNIVNGDDGYRSVNTTGIDVWLLFKIIYNVYTERMYSMLFLNNIILNLLFSFFCIILILKNKKVSTKRVSFIRNILLIVFVTYPLYKPLVVDTLKINLFHVYSSDFAAIFSLLFYFSILLTVFFYTNNKMFKHKLFFYLLSAGFLVLPLIFVNPFGPRNFIASYVFFVMAVIQLVHYIAAHNYFNLSFFNKLFSSAAVLIALCYVYVFALNDKIEQERMEYLYHHTDAKKESIMFTRLPFEQFLWMSTPDISGFHDTAFKKYHDIPINTELKIISYTDWKKQKERNVTLKE